uniref:Putative secreted protein n=1 Tax=Amblyomma cajennense TaxID=34607 RepID=A0A023FBX6_AMBCJ
MTSCNKHLSVLLLHSTCVAASLYRAATHAPCSAQTNCPHCSLAQHVLQRLLGHTVQNGTANPALATLKIRNSETLPGWRHKETRRNAYVPRYALSVPKVT